MNTCCEQENNAIRAEVARLRARDSLTGLYNRGHFYRFASAAVKKHREDAVQALLYIRPDHFSGIDERFGPLASDALLKALAEVINKLAGRNTVVSRFGGNVFTILLVRRSSFEIRKMAQDLLETVANTTFTAGDLTTRLTLSIGLVELTSHIKDPAQAFNLAQKAARKAREQGGNSLCGETSADMPDEERQEHRSWVRKILSALVEDRFQLAFQPIAGLMGTGDNINDVLVRMLDPEGQEILPGDFLPAAERAGLMPDIDKWVITQALKLAEEREEADSATTFILRVSEPSLLDGGFEEWLRSEFQNHMLAQSRIVFQVPEALAELHLPVIKSLSICCEQLGAGLAVAHFGLSETSLKLLQDLELSYVMVHGDFMEDLEDPKRRLQLEEIVAVTQERAIPTVATRVEDARALSVLCQIGIDYIQGYHLQQPDTDIFDNVALPG